MLFYFLAMLLIYFLMMILQRSIKYCINNDEQVHPKFFAPGGTQQKQYMWYSSQVLKPVRF